MKNVRNFWKINVSAADVWQLENWKLSRNTITSYAVSVIYVVINKLICSLYMCYML